MNSASIFGISLAALAVASAASAQTAVPGTDQPTGAAATASVADAAEDMIVVSGQRAQQQRAIDAKREAIGIVDVSASDEIGRLPDRNVAEVIERLPGIGTLYDQGEGRFVSVRGVPSALNNYTINGFEIGNPDGLTRALPLDVISGQLLNRVEVTKAKTADLDGQGIGGTINLVTQTAYDFADRFIVQASGQVGYQELDNDDAPIRGDISVGGRFGADEQFGIIVGASYSDRTYSSNGLYPDDWRPVPGAARGGLPINIKYTDYELTRERIGATGSFDYRPSDDHQFYVRGLYSRFTEDEYRQRFRLDFATDAIIAAGGLVFAPGGVTGTTTPTPARPAAPGRPAVAATAPEQRQDLRLEYKEKSVLSVSAGGSSRFGRWLLDYGIARVRNEVVEPNQLWQFRGNTGPVDFDFSDVLYTAAPRSFLRPGDLGFRQYSEQDENGDERIWQGRVDLRRDLGLGDESWIKVGAKYRTTDKSFDGENTTYTRGGNAATRFSLGQFDLTGPDVIVRPEKNRSYLNTPTIDADKIRTFTGERLTGPFFVLDPNATRSNGTLADFSLDESVTAAYAMANIEIGSLTITPGLRVERTKLDVRGFALRNNSTVVAVSDRNRRTDLLPSLILRARPAEDVVLRAAYTRSLGRPEYSDLLPGGSINTTDETATLGNPDLKPFVADALDAAVEWYFARGGLLSVGVFGKHVRNPILRQGVTLTNGEIGGQPFARLRVERPENAEQGDIVGLELGYQQQFTFLPGLLSGLGVEANLTLTDSNLRVPDRANSTFQGQANLLYGAQLFYQQGPIEASVAFHSTGKFLALLGDEPFQDQYSEKFERLDAKLNIAVTEFASIFFEAQNLTDEPTRFYQGGRHDWIVQHERYGRTYYAGASLRF